MTEQVAPVRRDLDVEDRVFGEQRRNRLSDPGFRRKNEETIALLGKTQLARTAKHSLRFNAAKLARLDFQIVHQDRARERERNLAAGLVIFRAADDLALLAAAIV